MQIPTSKFESNEIEIWGGLSGRHPNILELYGAMKFRQSGTVIIFMEYMSGVCNFFSFCVNVTLILVQGSLISMC